MVTSFVLITEVHPPSPMAGMNENVVKSILTITMSMDHLDSKRITVTLAVIVAIPIVMLMGVASDFANNIDQLVVIPLNDLNDFNDFSIYLMIWILILIYLLIFVSFHVISS